MKVGRIERRKGRDDVMPRVAMLHFQSSPAKAFRGGEIMETSLFDRVVLFVSISCSLR